MRMGDTLESVMERKGLTRYQLSKISGIPWSTLSNICTGKTDFEKCTVGTVRKLANALDLTIEETLDLETGMVSRSVKTPSDRSYLELDLPNTLAEAIEDVKAGFERDDPNMDLFLDALYGEINANQWSDMITKEQADYLRSKYYYGDPHD